MFGGAECEAQASSAPYNDQIWLLMYSRKKKKRLCGSLSFNKTYCAVLASDICLPQGSLPALLATGGACRGLFYVFFFHHGLW